MPRTTPPRAILLATDLSARCDRARDRAVQLARQWDARLIALTVAPPERDSEIRDATLGVPGWADAPPPLEAARRALQRDLDEAGLDARIRVEAGDPGQTALRVAGEEGCGLIVTGIARNEAFRPAVLGSTIAWLARHSPLPVLVVHARPRGAYRGVAVASDLSATARHALETAAACFPDTAGLAIVHAADPPRQGLLDSPADRDARVAQALTRVHEHLIVADLPDALRGRVEAVVEEIDPVRLLDLFVRTRGTDLLVLGSHGRSALFDILIGSVAQRMLETVRTDTLIVRDRQARD